MKARAFPNVAKQLTPEQRAEIAAQAMEAAKMAAMCLTKRAYPTKAKAAKQVSRRIGKLNTPSALRVYQCPHCDMWHLTKRVSKQ